ncbi:hypothetical protein L7F22_039257 [Adiantum nelumboides]|nr:hypothetical protein [Adiantum nelumboides]
MVLKVLTGLRQAGQITLSRSSNVQRSVYKQQQRTITGLIGTSSLPRTTTTLSRRSIGLRTSLLNQSPLTTTGLGTARHLSLWPFSKETQSSTSAEVLPNASDAKTEDLTSQEATLTAATSPSDPLAASDLANDAGNLQEAVANATEQVQTLADLGQLSSWPNVRAAQSVLDWLVEATGMPWWLTIAAVTLSVRILVLPFVLRGQKNAIRLANIQPQMQAHMKDIQYAKQTGDNQLMAKAATSVQQLMKDNDCNPFRSFIVPAIQAPLFMTFFFALRGLAEAGLPSMKTGGFSWFTDLTVADPTCVLPILSSLSMLLVLETGAEMGTSGGNTTPQAKMMRNVFRVVTVLAVPFIWNFPTAVFCYWLTNGCLSLIQLLVLNLNGVRKALKLPERVQHKPEEFEGKGKEMGFWDSISAGSSSQQQHTVQVIRKNASNRHAKPSALQEQRGMDESRERALKKIAANSSSKGQENRK